MAKGGLSSFFRVGVNTTKYTNKFANIFNNLPSSSSPLSSMKTMKPENMLSMALGDPGRFSKVFKQMNTRTFDNMVGDMTDAARSKFLKKLPDDVKTKHGISPKPSGKDVDVRLPDGTTKTFKYGSSGFWSAVRTGATIIGGLALLKWIDKKFEDAEEDYKNCMAGCLPHNWDEYDSGTLDKSKLKYSTVETLKENNLEPIKNQPYCKKNIKDCEKFCDEKCEKETEVDLPGSSTARGLFDKMRRTFNDFLPDIPGVDSSMISFASSASSMMMFMLIIMQFAV